MLAKISWNVKSQHQLSAAWIPINLWKVVKTDLSQQNYGRLMMGRDDRSCRQETSLTDISHLKMNQRPDWLGVLQDAVDLAEGCEVEVGGVEGGRVADDVHGERPGLHLLDQQLLVVEPALVPGDHEDHLISAHLINDFGQSAADAGTERGEPVNRWQWLTGWRDDGIRRYLSYLQRLSGIIKPLLLIMRLRCVVFPY